MTMLIRSVGEWKEIRESLSGKSIGFVPTMGALHQGHLSLIDRSMKENGSTVVSIFVNPTQFNDKKDLDRYPRNDERDIAILREHNVDVVFFPDYRELFPDDFTYKVTEHVWSNVMEGECRPGHFDGVLTVVMKLLNLIAPDRSYFGEKDYQQFMLISGMCKAFFMPMEIIACPTVREDDGLAMSSRNQLLSEEERKQAAQFPEILKSSSRREEIVQRLERAGFKVDYVEEVDNRRFGAVRLGTVRLIDNIVIHSGKD